MLADSKQQADKLCSFAMYFNRQDQRSFVCSFDSHKISLRGTLKKVSPADQCQRINIQLLIYGIKK